MAEPLVSDHIAMLTLKQKMFGEEKPQPSKRVQRIYRAGKAPQWAEEPESSEDEQEEIDHISSRASRNIQVYILGNSL